MTDDDLNRINAILNYWFADRQFDDQRIAFWFSGTSETDGIIREKFSADLERARRGELTGWQASPRGWLALIVLLDQFSRNIYRNTPQAFAHDSLAQRLTLEGIAEGIDRQLQPIERVFFYLPLEHAEDRALQARSVAVFEQLLDELSVEEKPRYQGFLDYAIRHREVIDRFGRFPDLNPILGRQTTPEEIEFLRQPGSSFL